MPMKQQNSNLAAKLGGRLAALNAEHKDAPVDTGNRRLPAGIREGIAEVKFLYTKEETEDNRQTPKGQSFFRASAVAMGVKQADGTWSPAHNGEKVQGMVTSVVIPMCDVPAKGERKELTLSGQWFEFQNIFKILGIAAPPETPATDPTGQKTWAYYESAMIALTNPQRPVYVKFSTRGWKSPKKATESDADFARREPMVFEEWHGLASPDEVAMLNAQHKPGTGLGEAPSHHAAPPTVNGVAPQAPAQTFTPPPAAPVTTSPSSPPAPMSESDLADEVEALVEVAMADPNQQTEEGEMACARLEELAWAAGATKEQTDKAADWVAVGDMALGALPAASQAGNRPAVTAPQPPAVPAVGSHWLFTKRDKDGQKLKNRDKKDLPGQEVEVVVVDAASRTCFVRTKDGRDVVGIKDKKPVAVKFEWLELLPY